MKRSIIFGHWEGTFILVNSILLKYAFYFLNTFPGLGGSAGWMLAVISCLILFGIIWLFGRFYRRIGSQDLLEVSETAFGKWGKYLIGIGLIGCFLFYSGINTVYFATSFRNSLLADSSSEVMIIFLIGTATYLAYKGLDAIARVHAFFVPLTLIATAVIALFLALEGSVYHLLPVFGTGIGNMLQNGYFALSGFFELILITFLAPHLKTCSEISKTLKLTFWFVAIATVLLSIVYIIAVPYPANIHMLSVIMMTPDYMTFHNIPQELFTFFSIFYCICTALYISVHLEICTTIFANLFGLKKTTPILFCFAALLLGITQLPGNMEQNQKLYEVGMSFLWIVGLVLPILIFLCYLLRRKKQCREATHEK